MESVSLHETLGLECPLCSALGSSAVSGGVSGGGSLAHAYLVFRSSGSDERESACSSEKKAGTMHATI